eukprot:35438_1
MQEREETTPDQVKLTFASNNAVIEYVQHKNTKIKFLLSKITKLHVIITPIVILFAIFIIIVFVRNRSPPHPQESLEYQHHETHEMVNDLLESLTWSRTDTRQENNETVHDTTHATPQTDALTTPKPKITVSGDPLRQEAIQFNTSITSENQLNSIRFAQVRDYFDWYNRGNTESELAQLRIIIIGDQGGHGGHTTIQYENAIKHIAKLHGEKGIHAILTVGDNVYSDGIDNNSHAMLDTLFKQPFSNHNLEDIPFFAVLGNHDHCLDPFEQIRYSMLDILEWKKAGHKSKHPIWIMPD